jgi:hypothetical protein
LGYIQALHVLAGMLTYLEGPELPLGMALFTDLHRLAPESASSVTAEHETALWRCVCG